MSLKLRSPEYLNKQVMSCIGLMKGDSQLLTNGREDLWGPLLNARCLGWSAGHSDVTWWELCAVILHWGNKLRVWWKDNRFKLQLLKLYKSQTPPLYSLCDDSIPSSTHQGELLSGAWKYNRSHLPRNKSTSRVHESVRMFSQALCQAWRQRETPW